MENQEFHLSVVATSRNDNHGKDLLYRMQCFVDGFIEQCKKHDLSAELILVEWNPPENNPSLAEALRFPADKGPCCIRIIRVSKEAHMKLNHADKIPLFQMIGKNVGIRRARGKFVLATNIDILFSDNVMNFIKKKLKKGVLYRVDRLDVPERLPEHDSFDEALRFCSKNLLRINHKAGTTVIVERTLAEKVIVGFRFCFNKFISVFKILFDVSLGKIVRGLISFRLQAPYLLRKNIRRILCFFYPSNSLILHTNACGDFTMLSREDWVELRGYPEWNIFSWHLDSILLHQARQHKIIEKDLARRICIYHIEHEVGSGYSAEGAKALFNRLDSRGIPYLSDQDLRNLVSEMKKSPKKVVYNPDNWGMADQVFEEITI